MSTFPLATLACTIDETGVSAPSFADILASIKASVEAIYGSDTYLTPDTKDGLFLAIFARAQSDSNQATIGAVAQYNPQTAVGVALDGAVQPNGIRRQAASQSSAIVTIVGQTGTEIFSGQVQDQQGNLWNLPDTVIIPNAGQIDVTAIAASFGNIVAPANTINKIFSITLGWQSVNNANPAVPGAPVEQDGALRERQLVSTSNNGETTLQAITGKVGEVAGVSRIKVYQNDNPTPDANGIPRNSIAVVVLGGDSLAVATAIEQAKDVGTGTFGTTTVTVVDPVGLPIPIKFFELALVQYYAVVTLTPLTGYTSAIGAQIAAALAAFVSGLAIGETCYKNWAEAVAGLSGAAQQTFIITSFTQGIAPNPVGTGDITVPFSSALTAVAANITVNPT